MTRFSFRLALMATVMAFPLCAAAQDKDSSGFDVADAPVTASQPTTSLIPSPNSAELTIGVGGVTETSDVYGRYNGMPRAGAGLLAGWDVERRSAWDSGKTHFLSFTGEGVNAGFGEILPETTITLKVGEQGHWWLSGAYSSMLYTASDHFTTILQPDGSLSPGYLSAITAAGAFVSNSATPNIGANTYYGTTYKASGTTGIASSGGSHVALYGQANELVDRISTRRDKGAVNGGLQLGSWLVTMGLSHEHKEGSLEQAMTTGGSNTGMVSFPMPVNYDTDIYSVSAAYNTRRFQAAFSYELSSFTDNNAGGYNFQGWNFTNVKDPVSKLYNAYQLSGNYSLPPSNQAHTFTAQVGYNPSSATRLNATLVYGLQFQNDPFVTPTNNAYTLNLGGVAGPTHNTLGAGAAPLGLNPLSLNGFVETWFGSASLYSRPTKKIDFKASYSVDVRDPHQQAMWIFGDPTDAVQNGALKADGTYASIKYRQAVPESWTKQKVSVSAGYRILPETTLTIGYTLRDDRRGNAITHHATDNEESVRLHSTINQVLTASVGYTHSDRTASAPDWSLWLVQIVSDCGSTLSQLGCQQVPFYEAARTQDAVSGNFTAAFNPKATLSLYAKYYTDQYHLPDAVYNGATNPGVGINHDSSLQIAPDFNYQFNEDNSVHVFYTYFQTYRAMRALNNQSVVGGGNYYSEATKYEIHTAGISATHRVNAKLKVGGDYTYSYGNVGFTQSGTWANNEAGQVYGGDPYLNTKSADHQVNIHAAYTCSNRMSVYLGYRFDSLDTTDWALVGASVGQVLTGDIPPKYNVHSIRAAMTLKF